MELTPRSGPEAHMTTTRHSGFLWAGALFGATALICVVLLSFVPASNSDPDRIALIDFAALALFSLGTGAFRASFSKERRQSVGIY